MGVGKALLSRAVFEPNEDHNKLKSAGNLVEELRTPVAAVKGLSWCLQARFLAPAVKKERSDAGPPSPCLFDYVSCFFSLGCQVVSMLQRMSYRILR
ncbi:hypothetical protein ACJMK2_030994 [Sinanodonta woodiana]|uniref:Uncharacterized protein n=1 Tax=Sinanodonta woodiana TaxID=1069815 RepID=A0ABD3X0Z8_SINWO